MKAIRHLGGKSWWFLLLIVLGAVNARATTYYVTTTGNNGNSGLSEGSAWRTVTYAATQATAGDTVYIKAGNYGNEHVVVSNSGSSGSPITFEGYGGWPLLGTLPSPRTTPSSSEIGFTIGSKSYITLRHLKFTWYYDCVYVYSSSYITLDDLYIDSCGGETSQGDGIWLKQSSYVTVQDSTVIDCGGNNVFLDRSNYCTVDGLTTLGTLSSSNIYCTDYYCVMRAGHDNVFQNSYAEDNVPATGLPSGKGNHGFAIKDNDYTPHSYSNQVIDCEAIGFEECFSAAHYVHDNDFIRCVADNSEKSASWSAALQVRNGSYDNTFIDCTATGRRVVVSMTDYAESDNYDVKYGNTWVNCTLKGIGQANSIGVLFNGAQDNAFENCVFDNVQYFARYCEDYDSNSGNSFKNSIIYNIDASYDPNTLAYPLGVTALNQTSGLSVTYTCFYGNGFSAFSGTGNFTDDPLFASSTDYHLQSTAGRWNGSTWVTDEADSPCIDTGDPSSSYSNEPSPNGDRINIGRYGNTDEASKTPGGSSTESTDNRLLERLPTTVYQTNGYLDIGHLTSYDKKYRDLIWFDLTPYLDDAPTSITDAELSLYWYYPSTTRTNATVVDVYRPATGWNSDYACWTNKASGTAWTNAGGDWYDANSTSQGTTPFDSVTFPAATTATNQYYEWNVTDLVKTYVTGDYNSGFLLKAHTESDNYIAFYGLGAASYKPKLSITRMASQSEPLAYDNRLKQSTPTTVLGTSTFNDVGTLSGSSYRDLIWFDLSPYDDVQTITKATLSLYWYYPSATRTNDTVVDIYRPASGWNKDYVCWTYKASGTAWTNAGGDWYDANGTAQGTTPFASVTFPAGTIATGQYYEFDVTDLVNYYRSTGTNAGFFIKAHTESDNYIAFYSLNYGTVTMRPKLEIKTTIE